MINSISISISPGCVSVCALGGGGAIDYPDLLDEGLRSVSQVVSLEHT